MHILYDNIQIDTESLSHEEKERLLSEHLSLYPAFAGSSLHRIDTPYFIATISFHPKDKNGHYIYTKYTPRHTFYMCYSNSEFLQYIKKDMHRHDFFEFLYVLKGSVYQNIEHKQFLYPFGSCCLLNKNALHMVEYPDSETQLVFIGINHSFFEQLIQIMSLNLFSDQINDIKNVSRPFYEAGLMAEYMHNKNHSEFISVSERKPPVSEVSQIFNTLIMQTMFPDRYSSMRVVEYLLRFFIILTNRELYRIDHLQIGSLAENRLFGQITDILQNSNGHVSRQELEQRLNYTGDYLNKITKKQTGLSLFSYSMAFCMKNAADLLLTTDLSVSAIAAKLGFHDCTHFYRVFEKTYHTTPAKYRKTHRESNSS